MSKHHLILTLTLLFLVGCNSSSFTTGEELETNLESTVEPVDIQQCDLTDEINEVAINTINQIRAEGRNCGTTFFAAADPVVWNSLLSTAAQAHSDDMASLNFFSHEGSNGSTLGERVSDTGYVWQAVGENISAGRSSLQDTVDGWLASSGHCANIMKPAFVEMAIACTNNSTSTYGVYWTQVFATQR